MKIITSELLESTGYKCLFECVQQLGIEPVLELVKDINSLPDKDILIHQTIMGKENDLVTLAQKNKQVIDYLKNHESELIKVSFTNQNVLNTLTDLSKDIALLNLYLENAKKLEKLKVEKILFTNIGKFNAHDDCYYCEFLPRNEREINYIHKCYTDGKVYPRLTEEEASKFNWCHSGYNQIPFTITAEAEHSFVLKTKNFEDFHQHRTIEIINFGFNGSKLPSEEEVQSYEIPKELIKK